MLFTGSRYIVAGVTLLIAYIAITSQVFVFIPWLMSISVQTTFMVLVPFNIGVGFIYWHYYLACTTEPGSTPPEWGVPKEDNDVADEVERRGTDTNTVGNADDIAIGRSTAIENQEIASEIKDRSNNNNNNDSSKDTAATTLLTKSKKKKTPLPRYCKNCEAFKPPRSHHCRICKKCILKMDHHCPWINNCVGHFNYGHFLRFITWVTITTGACMVLLLARVWDAIQNENRYMYRDDGPTKAQIVFLAVNILVDGIVLLAVGILCIYHLWSLMTNTSTIEVWEQEKVEAMVKKGKLRKAKFPYDVGCLRNYRQILGESFLLWLWPQPMQGSGTEFEVTDDKDAATVWPPREYHTSKRQARTFVSEYASSSGVHRRGGAGAGGRGGKNRNMSTLSTPITLDPDLNQGGGRRSRVPSRGSTMSGAAVPHFPTHVRRGSEGWIVQDLTVQQRADLYDRQLRYEQVHGQQQQAAYSEAQAADGDEEEDYQEGLSDIEGGDVYSQLPGGMQGNRAYEDYNDDAEYYDEDEDEEYASSDDASDLPYDVASDEWDENEYDEYDEEDDRYEDEVGSDLDQHNPYLAYADEDEEEGDYDEDVDVDVDDEVTLNGKNRHKIGRFFDNISRSTEDEWDEGEGIDVGCRPPGLMAKGVGIPETPYSATAAASTGQKTFYTMMLEREQALKEQIAVSGDGSGGAVDTKTKSKTKKKKKSK
ncbi:Palmitoyltransferase [Linnemannia gamsii]|uniref:Palmitoyltransferase PFA4 n=1 Tax=Linnemannia gamsii TaxID=64522 RepID=A0ABQ7KEV9_9FUNG|nr:Palmitoyltransferase [Linnemannia gamsii]